MDRFRLDGKTALVTGGTRGIGLAIAHALGEAGAKLAISGRSLSAEAREGLTKAGYNFEFIAADLSEKGAADRLIAEAISHLGGLDILVNNAGIAIGGPSTEFDDDQWQQLMAINLDAVFASCRAALPHMREKGAGVILNMGSISGYISNIPQNQVAYNTSKAAVHMMTKSLASEFAAENIRINAIAPGYIETDMTAGGMADAAMAKIWLDMTPMGRSGQVEEIAGAALFLCSPASSYMTGEIMVIDGGYTTR